MWTKTFVLFSCLALAYSSSSPQGNDESDYDYSSNEEDEYKYPANDDYEYPDYSYDDNDEYEYEYDDYYDENFYTSDDPALVVKNDFVNKKCSDFQPDGFECVPFYACVAGEIVTNGANLINIRSFSKTRKKRSIDLGPLDAQCFCENEICCRLPDYNNVTIEVNVTKLANVTGNEVCEKPNDESDYFKQSLIPKREITAAPSPNENPLEPSSVTEKDDNAKEPTTTISTTKISTTTIRSGAKNSNSNVCSILAAHFSLIIFLMKN